MGKLGKRKRNHAQNEALTKKQNTSTAPFEESAAIETICAVVAPEDVEITVETLETLARHPAIIKSKACKDLRTAVFSFRKATTTGLNAAEGQGLTACISAALTDAKFTDALIMLAEMRIRGETPTLGALCRWVRQLDVVSGISTDGKDAVRPASDRELLRVLDAVLRVTGPTDSNLGRKASTGPIAVRESWNLRSADQPTRQTQRSVEDKSIFDSCPPDFRECFGVLESTPGAQRKPPNLHPAVLFTSKDNAVQLGAAPQTTCHTHPIVPNLRLIEHFLTPDECSSIIAAGETVEFIPDAPAKPEGEESSILAHNFYWMIDQPFHDKLWARVKPFVPESVSGRQVRGINRRFRVYRYVPGAEYRLHIDGAWPPSGIDATTGAYQYDSSTQDARQSSLFTFLIYLNDDFKGGETTFLLPSVQEGVMNAYPVKPIMGSVAVFPHGEAQGALLHEGTGVTEGAKYVIRTDVEYDVNPTT